MIPRSKANQQRSDWQIALSQGIADAAELLAYLQLQASDLEAQQLVQQHFATRVPLSFVERMRKHDPHDPLLLQVLASAHELNEHADYSLDPLQEQQANKLPGLLHKYHGRVLLTLSGACAINCRYCFRRHFSYDDNQLRAEHWPAIADYIQNDPNIHEIILSGGDPLLLNDRRWRYWLECIAALPQINTLRIHSRIPVVLPERINDDFIDSLQALTNKQIVMVIHSNHANEINHIVKQRLARLRTSGVHLLNQSVLLRAVNDDAQTLIDLSHTLFDAAVLPYYLHTLDPIQGTQHFAVSARKAQSIYQTLLAQLPGYLVPRLVTEIAGDLSKRPLLVGV